MSVTERVWDTEAKSRGGILSSSSWQKLPAMPIVHILHHWSRVCIPGGLLQKGCCLALLSVASSLQQRTIMAQTAQHCCALVPQQWLYLSQPPAVSGQQYFWRHFLCCWTRRSLSWGIQERRRDRARDVSAAGYKCTAVLADQPTHILLPDLIIP